MKLKRFKFLRVNAIALAIRLIDSSRFCRIFIVTEARNISLQVYVGRSIESSNEFSRGNRQGKIFQCTSPWPLAPPPLPPPNIRVF